ncbi:imelysin family protein [uncultured Proteiniphilum sp.]|uniref:imelysin family protein n=1 Tax=uncultured Proteiniphilum sp. TaxID=497637 RepID=UPI00261D8CC0|nr:imelysin family protein [uncultured Proteiniphilum sp.]
MKKLLKLAVCFFVAALFVSPFVACDNDPDIDISVKEEALSKAVEQYVNNTVIYTYRNLADATIDLYGAIETLKVNKTNANLNAAAEQWIETRAHWELSEAFLYGAVADFGIDPHIDTWPLDETAFVQLINNNDFIAGMDAEDGDVWASEHLGNALLGFHGVEYILFSEGEVKSASAITEKELIYALAVMGDLRNQCIRLEAAWAGYDAVTKEKQTLIDDLELGITPSNSNTSYGENMLTASKPGSTYKTITAASLAILDGCAVISEEVGDLKIGNAWRGDDRNYLESPYSYNSLVDFENNIISIENAYLGGAEKNKRGGSVSDYIKSVNPTADTKVKNAITNAITKIKAIPYPFERNYSSTQAGAAIDACTELTNALNEAKVALAEGD